MSTLRRNRPARLLKLPRRNSMSSVVFVPVPESLRGEVGDSGFVIDPSIPIPVELAETAFEWDRLSAEMILSGLIRAVAEDPEAENAGYYRRFVLAVKPNILEEFTAAAILQERNGEYDAALEIITALSRLFPGSSETLLNRALILENRAAARRETLERSGKAEEADLENALAHEAYNELISLDPPFPNGLFNAGFFYIKQRDFVLAKYCFSAYIPLADDEEKQKQALKTLREIDASGLDDPAFREAYAVISRKEDDPGLREAGIQEGLLKVRDFLERRPQVWNGWFLLGWGLRLLGRWEDGAASFRKALELGGDTGDTRNELAICLMELGDYAAARKELEAALRSESENIKIISNLGILALKQGKREEARGFFRIVLELDPADPLGKAWGA